MNAVWVPICIGPCRAGLLLLLSGLPGGAFGQDSRLPESVEQGSLVRLCCFVGASASLQGQRIAVSEHGHVVFGVGRDESGPLKLVVSVPGHKTQRRDISVRPHPWRIEKVDGVPPKTVNPPPEIAKRIAQEQARVAAARERSDAREDFADAFIWPVHGRISGEFGSQRVYNGQPGSAHSGMDIAATTGTPVRAPAGGTVTFADPNLYLTGGTVLIDHGQGVSSVFLHLSRLDVAVGQVIQQGQMLGAVGATGRASGPHLHWGMNWFGTRLNPASVVSEP